MAVIGQIRKHSGLIVVIVGVALAAFVLGDFLQPRNKYQANYIGEIAGEEILAQDFNTKVEEQIQIRREQQQSDKLTEQDAYQIRQGVWSQMVEEIIMGQEYKKLGLTVTSEELSDQILGSEPHRFVQQSFKNPNTQTFDREMVKNFLQNLDEQQPDMKRRYLNLEKMVKEDRLKTKFKNLLTKSYYIPAAFAKLDYVNKTKSVNFRFVAPKFTSISDSSVKVTDDDLRKYYEEFIYNYQQEDIRNLDYVVFEIKATAEDRQEIATEINRLFQEFQTTADIVTFVNSVSDSRYDSAFKKQTELQPRIANEMMTAPIGTFIPPYIENENYYIAKLIDRQSRPDSIKMSQILISYETAPAGMKINERSEISAMFLVDSILQAIKKSPEKYEQLAIKYSDYPSADQDKGDIGWMVDGDPGYANFFNEGLKLKPGEISKMDSPLGFHVIKVTDKTKTVDKAKIALISRAIEPSNQTYQDVYMQASRFSGENRTLVQFDAAVTNMGLTKKSADNLSQMSNRIAGIDNPRQIVRWAFVEKTKPGDVSPVFEDGKRYVVAALKDVGIKGDTPFEKVKEQIRPLVVNRKKADMLTDRVKNLNSRDLSMIASSMNEKVDTATNINFMSRNIPGFGRENEVIGKLLTLQTSGFDIIKGNNAVFVVVVDKINEPAQISDHSMYANQLKGSLSTKLNSNAFFKALEKDTEITDNRLLFY